MSRTAIDNIDRLHSSSCCGRRRACAGSTLPRAGRLNCIVEEPVDVLALRQTSLREAEAAEDRGQDMFEIVSHTASELADGFHLLGLEKLFLLIFERFLRSFALGQVARDLGKPTVPLARRGSGRSDVGPEPGAVLAHSPASASSVLARCGLESLLRNAGSAIFRSKT